MLRWLAYVSEEREVVFFKVSTARRSLERTGRVSRLGSVMLCCLAGMLVAAAPSSAAIFTNVKGKADGCFLTRNAQYINVGVFGDVSYNDIYDTPQPWPEILVFETTIKLRELYGTRWKRLAPRRVRSPEHDLAGGGESGSGNRQYFYGSRLYPDKAFRKLRRLRGTAQVKLRDAETGEVLAQTEVVRFSWTKRSYTYCQLGPPPVQLPIVG